MVYVFHRTVIPLLELLKEQTWFNIQMTKRGPSDDLNIQREKIRPGCITFLLKYISVKLVITINSVRVN